MGSCKVCDKNCYGEYCFNHKPKRPMRKSRLKQKGKKTKAWLKFKEHYKEGKADYRGYYTCVSCGKQTKNIHVDHRIKRSVAPDKVFDEDNLQLLCDEPPNWCHSKKDSGQNIVAN